MKLADIRSSGFRVRLVGDDDLGISPASRLPKPMLQEIKAAKPELLSELKAENEARQVPFLGPGTELEKLIPKLLSKLSGKGCGCSDYKQQMNAWGIPGCLENIGCIEKRLVRQAKKFAIPEFISSRKAKSYVSQAIENARMSVVWVYHGGGAVSEELRYSMRAAQQNLADCANLVVCGDRPPWYDGEFIHCPKIARKACISEFGSPRFAKWIDSVIKLQAIIDSPLVSENFLWMYDDTFIMRQFSSAQIAIPRAGGLLFSGDWEEEVRRSWSEVRRRSVRALLNRQLPIRDFSTHYPVVYNKQLLQKTIKDFRARKNARVIESLYMNQHFTAPLSLHRILQYQKRARRGWKYSQQAYVLNIGSFNQHAATALVPCFSQPIEQESAPPADWLGKLEEQSRCPESAS